MIKRILSLLLFISFHSYALISYGDGSDGDCFSLDNGLQLKNTFHCTSLNITGSTSFPTGSVVRIYVDGDVTIDGTLNLDASTTTSGPGGGAGGDFTAGNNECSNADAPGSNGGEGQGGITSPDNGASGPGGSGGQYSGLGTDAQDGGPGDGTNTGGTPGAFGVAPTGSFGNAEAFDVTITGGRGGGGSGGALYIVSGESIILSNTSNLSVSGGTGGNGGTAGLDPGGDGGDGGDGWIRLEAPSGNIINEGVTSTYSFNLFSTGEPPSYLSNALSSFSSDIGVGCARVEMQDYHSYLGSLFFGFLLIMGLGLIPRRNH